jgi:hypothetical protein
VAFVSIGLRMNKGLLNLPWFLWAGLALMIAVVYSVLWPQKAAPADTGIRFFILRWGHALTWLLLALNFLLRGLSPSLNGVANLLALAGGVMYFFFLMMTFMVK